MRTAGSPPLRRRCKSEVAGRMQSRYGFAAGFCRRPCRPLSPDMKSYWMTGNKTCGKRRAPAPRFFFCVDMASGDGTTKPDMQGRFFCEKPPRIRFSGRTAVPPLAAVALSGGHFAKGLYRLLTVKLRFPGGLRGFVAENVSECRLIFLCKNPDLLFLLW